MSKTELFLTYLRHYADKNIEAISAMFADGVTLRDWRISVVGKAAAVAETAQNFSAAKTIGLQALALYENADTVAGELKITVDGETELFVVDVMRFDTQGRIVAIRAYLGRGDEPEAR